MELIGTLLDGEPTGSTYTPVVQTTATGEPERLRTCDGDVPITAADLAEMEPACPPLDLERERREPEAIESSRTEVTR
jgi:hypothetical protein